MRIQFPLQIFWPGAKPTMFSRTWPQSKHRTTNLSSQGQPESLRSAAVTHNYFSVLGVTPQIGRTFEATEDQPGNDRIKLFSHELWQRRFGADASILGRVIRINREDYTVIGVIPETFRLLGFTRSSGRLLPSPPPINPQPRAKITTSSSRAPRCGSLPRTISRRNGHPRSPDGTKFPRNRKRLGAVRTLPDFLLYTFGIASGIAVMMTAVAFVLLIACANVAGLLLARAAGHRKELAVRVALRSRPSFRIIRQLLTEGLVIAFIGGGLGLLLSYWGINFVRASLTFNDEISAVPLSLDTNVLLFAIAASAACAVMCGLIPSLKASRANSNSTLKDETRAATASRSYSRTRTIMVAAEWR